MQNTYGLDEINNVNRIREKLTFLKAKKESNAVQPKTLLPSSRGSSEVLYPESKIAGMGTYPDDVRSIGGGLRNLGNSCFMNSSLQCIAYTPPFFNFCRNREHSRNCQSRKRFCAFCCLEKVVNNMTISKVYSPQGIFTKLGHFSKTLRPGRQEDAHEFIRVLLDTLHETCCDPYKTKIRLDKRANTNPLYQLQYTTPIHRIWGGFLRSQVHCQSCNTDSNTDDPVLGISLATASTLEKAFQQYTARERLCGTEKYFCEHCKKKQNAYKRFSILKTPVVLCIHLKRFEFSASGNRIKKKQHVRFERLLNLTPFLTDPKVKDVKFELQSVLVHSGSSAYGGHYYSFVKSPSSSECWFCMNDSSVTPVTLKQVLAAQAYILIYQQTSSTLKRTLKHSKKGKKPTSSRAPKPTAPTKQNPSRPAEVHIYSRQKKPVIAVVEELSTLYLASKRDMMEKKEEDESAVIEGRPSLPRKNTADYPTARSSPVSDRPRRRSAPKARFSKKAYEPPLPYGRNPQPRQRSPSPVRAVERAPPAHAAKIRAFDPPSYEHTPLRQNSQKVSTTSVLTTSLPSFSHHDRRYDKSPSYKSTSRKSSDNFNITLKPTSRKPSPEKDPSPPPRSYNYRNRLYITPKDDEPMQVPTFASSSQALSELREMKSTQQQQQASSKPRTLGTSSESSEAYIRSRHKANSSGLSRRTSPLNSDFSSRYSKDALLSTWAQDRTASASAREHPRYSSETGNTERPWVERKLPPQQVAPPVVRGERPDSVSARPWHTPAATVAPHKEDPWRSQRQPTGTLAKFIHRLDEAEKRTHERVSARAARLDDDSDPSELFKYSRPSRNSRKGATSRTYRSLYARQRAGL